MKKTIAALFAIVSAAVFAGANDLLISFSSPDGDTYADGKPVLKGELYALVFTPAGENAEPQTVFTFATKEAGHCSPVVYVVSETNQLRYASGTWSVYLLDTRNYEGDPEKDVYVQDGDTIKENNTRAKVSNATIDDSFGSADSSKTVAASSFVIPDPVIAGIEVKNAEVIITVKDVVPCIGYTLESVSGSVDFSVPDETKDFSNAREIDLVVPKKDGAQFFKVTSK